MSLLLPTDPVNPLMTLSLEGLFAEVTVHDKETDLNGCARIILDDFCGKNCKVGMENSTLMFENYICLRTNQQQCSRGLYPQYKGNS